MSANAQILSKVFLWLKLDEVMSITPANKSMSTYFMGQSQETLDYHPHLNLVLPTPLQEEQQQKTIYQPVV